VRVHEVGAVVISAREGRGPGRREVVSTEVKCVTPQVQENGTEPVAETFPPLSLLSNLPLTHPESTAHMSSITLLHPLSHNSPHPLSPFT